MAESKRCDIEGVNVDWGGQDEREVNKARLERCY